MSLIDKYNVSVPRYTSYPPVPQWNHQVKESTWLQSINKAMDQSPDISLYIHLPFCENLCTYCACNKRITKNHDRESPYIDNLLREWSYYIDHLDHQPVLREIHFGGGTPTFFSHHQLARLLDGLFDRAIKPKEHSYSFEAHPNSTTIDHLRTLSHYGFNRISIGVQDISCDVMTIINRYQSVDQITAITQAARDLLYDSINYDLIYGLPLQGEQEVIETMNYVRQMMPERIAYYSYAHVPWKSKGQRAYSEKDLLTGEAKQRLKNIGQQMLADQGYQAIAMDHLALERDSLYQAYKNHELHRNFMGYTTQQTQCLIGLGVSSISQTPDMFVQNDKKLEDYAHKISQGLAIKGGHRMSQQQKLMQGHILDLMCHHQTVFSNDYMDQLLYNNAIVDLIELQEDKLITINERTIKVTDLGMPLVRNICAAIDPQFRSVTHGDNQYSKAI